MRLQHVSSRFSGFILPWQCLCGKLQNLSLSKASKQVAMSFCVAGVALCDIQTCFVTCQKSFCGRRSTLDTSSHFAWQAQHFGHVELSVFANSTVRAASSGDTQHSTLHTFSSTFYTLHCTLYTPFLFSHNYDSGVRYHKCEHWGSWASSGIDVELVS